jgi:hypothetical protein
MGRHTWPVYSDADLGSAIEDAKTVIAKIETNKFDNHDLVKLDAALAEIRAHLSKNEN